MKLNYVFIYLLIIVTIMSCGQEEPNILTVNNPPPSFLEPNTQVLLNDVGTFHNELCLYILDTVPQTINVFQNINDYHLFWNIVNDRLYNHYSMDTSVGSRAQYFNTIFNSTNLNLSFKNKWQSICLDLPLNSCISSFEINLIEEGLAFLSNIDTSLSNNSQRDLISSYADSMLQICNTTNWEIGEHGIPSTGFFTVMKNSALLWGSYPDNKFHKDKDEVQFFQIVVAALCLVVEADCAGALVGWGMAAKAELDATGTLSKANEGK